MAEAGRAGSTGAAAARCATAGDPPGDPTAPYVDVANRLIPPTTPTRPATPVASVELLERYSAEGSIEDTDALFQRILISAGTLDCFWPPETFEYNVDLYAVTLVGPGPHNLVADTCNSAVVNSTWFDTELYLYQDDAGSDSAFDLDNACPHVLAEADDGCSNAVGPTLLRATGLREGVVLIAVTTFGLTSPTARPYVLELWSDTSCE